jgi:hypothetical protein
MSYYSTPWDDAIIMLTAMFVYLFPTFMFSWFVVAIIEFFQRKFKPRKVRQIWLG